MLFKLSEETVAQRIMLIYLVGTDGTTPATGENGGQPQLVKPGGAYANTTNTLVHLASGTYTLALTQAELDTLGINNLRYKSVNTLEYSMPVQVVAFDPYNVLNLGLTNLDVAVSSRQAGAGLGLNQTTVRVLSSAVAVIGALVSITDETNTSVVAYGVTNSQGKFVFFVNDGTYNARIATTPGYAPIAATELIVNDDLQQFDIELEAQQPEPPASPLVCRVFGFVYGTDGLPAPNEEIKFNLETTGAAEVETPGIAFLKKKELKATSDATGYFFADVLRSSQVNPWVALGNVVTYRVTSAVTDPKSITVPDADTYNLVTALP